jgi:hypothetical protein
MHIVVFSGKNNKLPENRFGRLRQHGEPQSSTALCVTMTPEVSQDSRWLPLQLRLTTARREEGPDSIEQDDG